MNKIFNKVPVQIQNRSGFDMSHSNLYTMHCGTLYPILVDQLIPGDKISLGHLTEVQLPPMSSDFYGRLQFKIEVFFCPNRLCYGGFQNFITHNYPKTGSNEYRAKYLPYFNLPLSDAGPGSLADMLGLKYRGDAFPASGIQVSNSLPFIAYHRIWDAWYRDSLLQRTPFGEPWPNTDDYLNYATTTPFVTYGGDSPFQITPTLGDQTYLYSLRQRCWAKDYFTNAKANPQNGTAAALSFSVNNNNGSFTISSLRAANSIQQWMDRQNLAGNRYIDQIKANYGVTPSDAILDRPVYLGSHSFDIYNKSVYQTGESSTSTNPFNSVGAKYASPLGVSDSSLVQGFEASEFGFLFVIGSIVPEALYSSGSRRYLDYSVMTDFANPILSNVGDQEILKKELLLKPILNGSNTFGYSQRYSEYKFMLDEVHGELVDKASLESFALQRSFDNDVTLGSDFVEIPTNYLDQVLAVKSSESGFSAWANTYFTYKKSSVLPAYSIPTLGDLKDTHTEIINNGGVRL